MQKFFGMCYHNFPLFSWKKMSMLSWVHARGIEKRSAGGMTVFYPERSGRGGKNRKYLNMTKKLVILQSQKIYVFMTFKN